MRVRLLFLSSLAWALEDAGPKAQVSTACQSSTRMSTSWMFGSMFPTKRTCTVSSSGRAASCTPESDVDSEQ